MILHEKQRQLLKLIASRPGERITRQEMMDTLGFSSKSVVQHHLNQLVEKRMLKTNPNKSGVYFTYDTPQIPLVYLKLYGRAKCGPDGDILSGVEEDTIAISSTLIKGKNPEDAFLVYADGNSMAPTILNKDIVIGLKGRTAENGDLIIGSLNGEALIKRYRQTGTDHILLESLNPDYETIVVTKHDQLIVAGHYLGLIRV